MYNDKILINQPTYKKFENTVRITRGILRTKKKDLGVHRDPDISHLQRNLFSYFEHSNFFYTSLPSE